LTQLLDAEWNADTYRYVKRGSKWNLNKY
jgi:hypothetical protein